MWRWVVVAGMVGCAGDPASSDDGTDTGGNGGPSTTDTAPPFEPAAIAAAVGECEAANRSALLIVGLAGDRRDLLVTWWLVGAAGSIVEKHADLEFNRAQYNWSLYATSAETQWCPAEVELQDQGNHVIMAHDQFGRRADCVVLGQDADAILSGSHGYDPDGPAMPDVTGCRVGFGSGW